MIRSNYDVPDDDPSIVACERHIVPPSTGEDMAADPRCPRRSRRAPGGFELCADRRPGRPHLQVAVGLEPVRGQIDSSVSQREERMGLLPARRDTHDVQPGLRGAVFTYVLAKGVALLNLPGKKDAFVRARSTRSGCGRRRAVRLVVTAGSGAPVLPAPATSTAPSW